MDKSFNEIGDKGWYYDSSEIDVKYGTIIGTTRHQTLKGDTFISQEYWCRVNSKDGSEYILYEKKLYPTKQSCIVAYKKDIIQSISKRIKPYIKNIKQSQATIVRLKKLLKEVKEVK